MSIRTYKYKLYETKRLKHLHDVVNVSGIIYNYCIALHKRYYKLYGKSLNKFQLQKHLTKLKKRPKYAFWNNVPSQAIQNITERIDGAYKKFFDYAKGKTKSRTSPPSFKAVKKYKSYTLKGKVGYKIDKNSISLNGYNYKFWLSRPIDGIIKTVIIKRDTIGDFYICITIDKKKDKFNVTTGKSAGVDFGMITFLTLDEQSEIESPLFHLKNLSQQKKLNRNLSKKKKGSSNRKKAKFLLAKLHIKTANQRRDYFHKLSNQLAKEYDTIFMEDLNMKAMQMMWGRKISDLAFSEFVNILEYKTNVVKIDRFFPSSKTCSHCGHVLKELNPKIREWTCSSCSTSHLRDVNAAINIKRVGTSTLSGETIRPMQVGSSC